jgi:pilus assembly protein CpaB
LLIGAIAVALAVRWIGLRTEVATTKVVVASRDLVFGTQLKEGMLEVIDWPATGALKEPVSDPHTIYQRVINTQVLRGEPLLNSKLAAQGEKAGLSALLHEGSRAVTVRVNEIVGVAGFALPGNYVDVMVHASDKSNRPFSKIVLERILVLALAQDASTGETKPRVVNAVTLEVTPQQAEQIDLARSVGSLSLVLRSQVDTGRVSTTGVRMDDLFKQGDGVVTNPSVASSEKSKTVTNSPRIVNRNSSERLEIIRGISKTLE